MTKPITNWYQLNSTTKVRIEFKLADFWIGAFWSTEYLDKLPPVLVAQERKAYHLWVCLLPCLPIHFIKSGEIVNS